MNKKENRIDLYQVSNRNIGEDIFSYDYFKVVVPRNATTEIIDCYEALSWELVDYHYDIKEGDTLSFRRDRKISKKEELNHLQENIDKKIEEIKKAEGKKTSIATVVSVITSMLGTILFIAGLKVFLTESVGFNVAAILAASAGLAIGGLSFLVYLSMREQKTKEMNIFIDKKFSEINRLLEEASVF